MTGNEQEPQNTKLRFNDGWQFAKSGLDEEKGQALSYAPVDLPHDWLIYNTRALYENSIGWYRKRWTPAAAEGERLFLAFDGVYQDSTVYVNGQQVGEWKNGYSSFECEITETLTTGENEIVVKVVHQSPNSRWYSGAGIYRNIWLKRRGNTFIDTDGIYVAITEQADDWLVEIDTELTLTGQATVTHTISRGGETLGEGFSTVSADETGAALSQLQFTVRDPLLWSPDDPHLYELTTRLMRFTQEGEQQIVETLTQRIGFRNVLMDPDQGLLLNGGKYKINGVCEHHDLGALGAAFNASALRRRLQILKDMGVNGIRTAHNMPAPELMDLADEMGFLVASEAFDMWERSKTTYDYARFFPEWAARDVRSWVRRDRNHASLIMWSIGNEIYDTHADERGQEVTRFLMVEVQKHDPKGNARVTIGSNYMPWPNARACADIVKVAGYNYAEKYYPAHHEAYPDWIIYGSETASVVQSRGIYHFPLEAAILADDDEQCSALGNSSTSWGAKSAEACIIAERDTPFSLGQFIWTGFDYIGEPTPYHTKNSYFGQIDTAGFPKDSYYIYQAGWTDYRKQPMVHLFPYWDFNPGQLIDVRVCSNAPKIELQLNGETIGTHTFDREKDSQLVGWWKVPYEPGELKAIAYDEEGTVIATDVRTSFGDARKIQLHGDKDSLTADGVDLLHVEITVEDERGRLVDNAVNRVDVEVTGAGRLIGLDNGDSTDYDGYKGVSRRLFSGKLLAIVAPTLEPGTITVTVTGKGLEASTATWPTLPTDPEALAGVSAQAYNVALPCELGDAEEVPLRKIELISESGQQLNPSQAAIRVRAQLHPADTSYQDLEWRVVTDTGIDSAIARVESDGPEATITALGDGSFRLRAMSKNGSTKVRLISQLEFHADGLGTAYKDPYGFISGGLYDDYRGDVGSGNERGVATSRDGETQVGFTNIDFGSYGSDKITMPIFTLSSEPYTLQIWEGQPGERDSELVADLIYQKPSKWNVYQEETYQLTKRLQGITSLWFVTRKKMHLKGFTFEAQNRALARNAAADGDRIYGDTYTVAEGRVEGIGNNVSLEFSGMDFGESGVRRLVIRGRAPINNTIHVRFADETGESNQLVEFTTSDGYEERSFELEPVRGNQRVTFIFLPGSNFDFDWFRFEG
ncbi:glycoside hydrolase family 2 TIM barrel-domain containing protein [Paenibacillus daejeonensis]|uniref:glycoside hydrolase family 2 TIM barrel-domain containing protein n=1 Tax=Paenibacillus daejeonensis TaxID=135193 RepID=UPI000370451B|nr:glycoside hydrolase family 2 TIM barrel-domain containing protein [Paenibacillus daejeonensis]